MALRLRCGSGVWPSRPTRSIVPSEFARERLRELGAPLDWERVHVLAPPVGLAGGSCCNEVGQLCAGRVAARPREGSRRGDRGLPNRRCAAGRGGRRSRARDADAHARAMRTCALSDAWTPRSWIACAGALRWRSSRPARLRRSGWQQPRRWRQACPWLRVASEHCRSSSSRRAWSIPATPRRSPRRSSAAGATWPRQSVGERACGSYVRRSWWLRGWRRYMGRIDRLAVNRRH